MGFNLKSVPGCQLFRPRQPTADILPSGKFLSVFSSFWWKLAEFQTSLELVWDKEKGLIIKTLCLLNTKLIEVGIIQPSGGSAPWTSWMCVKPTDTNGQKHVSTKMEMVLQLFLTLNHFINPAHLNKGKGKKMPANPPLTPKEVLGKTGCRPQSQESWNEFSTGNGKFCFISKAMTWQVSVQDKLSCTCKRERLLVGRFFGRKEATIMLEETLATLKCRSSHFNISFTQRHLCCSRRGVHKISFDLLLQPLF